MSPVTTPETVTVHPSYSDTPDGKVVSWICSIVKLSVILKPSGPSVMSYGNVLVFGSDWSAPSSVAEK